ncbi:ComE operon protein 2 [Sporolactobacillus putidus]|uniref:ComE operon protein 2 n=1 Tax=Sporolactobacillus putidus TaxID=492735 RepID=A0A917RWE0_9BACL|nr:ComE operon protein 2 [Sporolactobacillus putidus]GGL40496.1 ComE operon protein 2 [Sporolactobacillus putidus]
MKRLSWDQYFMAQSHLLASRSTCTRLVVGATIVRDKRIIAGGYNGSISGGVHCTDEGCYLIDGHCARTIHAEMNAILQCAKFGEPTEGAEIYVTHFPCVQCTKSIIQAGIRSVYYARDYRNHPYAEELFKTAKIAVKKVPFDNIFAVNEEDISGKQLAYIASLFKKLEESGVKKEELHNLYNQAEQLFARGM